MNGIAIASWRDAALIVLAAEAVVLILPPAVALYWGLGQLRKLSQGMRPILFQTRLHVWKAQHGIVRVLQGMAAPFVWLQSTVAGLQRALEKLGWR